MADRTGKDDTDWVLAGALAMGWFQVMTPLIVLAGM